MDSENDAVKIKSEVKTEASKVAGSRANRSLHFLLNQQLDYGRTHPSHRTVMSVTTAGAKAKPKFTPKAPPKREIVEPVAVPTVAARFVDSQLS